MRNRTSIELCYPNDPQMLSHYMVTLPNKPEQWTIDYWWGNFEPIMDES